MSRRSHHKSRNGCVECKQRHIRCDETLPICVNCRTATRHCSYADRERLRPHRTYPSPASTCGADGPSLSSSDLPNSPDLPTNVNVEHFEFFFHFCTVTSQDFRTEQDQAQSYFGALQESITSAPYLLHAVLAISALHLSLLRPAQQDYYRTYASKLQTQALSLFNKIDPSTENLNTLPSLIFCGLTGAHVLCDALRYHGDNLYLFLDRFTHFLRIHRGVKIVASGAWASFRQSKLGPHLERAERQAHDAQPGTECEILRRMLDQADIGPKALEIYYSVVKHLQWAYDVDRNAGSLSESRQMLMAWTVLAPSEYADLLEQRRPEALVILAHYGMLLHRHHDFWLVGDGGEFLVQMIKSSLGTYWEQWLQWPSTETGPSLVSDAVEQGTR